ncbi:MAG: M23 family metallopeptidase [bacterium]
MKIKNFIKKRTSNLREKIIFILTNQYIIHIIIIVVASLVAFNNLFAKTKVEDYGQTTLIYKVIGVENNETLEDTAASSPQNQIYSYLGESANLSSKDLTETSPTDTDYGLPNTTVNNGGALIKPEMPNTEVAKAGGKTIQEYTVLDGDAIGLIANKFGITVNTILWANNLSFQSIIKPGQKLLIPPTSGILHKIQRGDTLNKIAKLYDADISKITDFNNLTDDSTLTAGEQLMVPGGRIVYTPRPRAYTAPTTATGSNKNTTITDSSSGSKMIWPSSCHYISQYFKGWLHTGVDIACDWGTPVHAAGGGTVISVVYGRTGYGYHVIVDNGNGRQTLYGHLSSIYVKQGQEIDRGETIGLEGSTGRSTGPHLHFEVRVGGSRVNPLNYIR